MTKPILLLFSLINPRVLIIFATRYYSWLKSSGTIKKPFVRVMGLSSEQKAWIVYFNYKLRPNRIYGFNYWKIILWHVFRQFNSKSLPSSKDLLTSLIEESGTLNWSVWLWKNLAILSTRRDSTWESFSSSSFGKVLSNSFSDKALAPKDLLKNKQLETRKIIFWSHSRLPHTIHMIWNIENGSRSKCLKWTVLP